jgi:hypothetical protein
MKVARVHSFVRNKFLVPAGIVIVGCVKRLMQVADEVQQELQGRRMSGTGIVIVGCVASRGGLGTVTGSSSCRRRGRAERGWARARAA